MNLNIRIRRLLALAGLSSTFAVALSIAVAFA